MKKIVLKESQVDKLMEKMVSEQITDNNRYTQEVTCSFGYHDLNFREGEKIDWIPDVKCNVSFTIDMEARTYGIKGVTVGDVRGPEEIEIEVSVLPEGSEDPELYPRVMVQPEWRRNVIVHNDADIGWIGISPDIEIELAPGENRGYPLGVRGIDVHSKEI